MDSDAHACPDCGQSVDTVVRRHKTLGAWVPVWVAGPCRNPKCEAYVGRATQAADADGRHRTQATHTVAKRTSTGKSATEKT
ncbi:hypothetical protein [Streptomyces resistomycificus]|uniref:Uncharacterized protein n=1 Tax=Streptomyces resistomycificus TaxID=67356 RepID=A0A0L8LIW3_9ACTN|nr:hypothetical protein [Streptomyces resistomycificus]KOG38158.1 hypothetical protein ADK37_10485 [Streptomyces resistomycificus]KUN98729.1 hypothetical protein AQJ84_13820 [Streptomyces resistomycificus]